MARPKTFDEEQVLEKAVDLFWRQGFYATSIQDVVEHLQINRASLYDTYGDKRTLFIKALERYRADETQAMIRFLRGPGNPFDKIRSLLEKTVEVTLADQAHKGCFIVNTAIELVNHDPEIARLAQDNQLEIERALAETIQRGQAAGQISSRNTAEALAQYLLSQFNGLRVVGKMNPDKQVLENVIRVALAALEP